jgi:hypothetical protein
MELLVILAFWGFYSRFISYMMAPVLIVLTIVFDILYVIVAIVFRLVDSPLLVIVRPIRRVLIKRQFRADKTPGSQRI